MRIGFIDVSDINRRIEMVGSYLRWLPEPSSQEEDDSWETCPTCMSHMINGVCRFCDED